ncbi:hypothetical protein CJD36_015280 [Flavipsychrobacter stenotrophus]|uniref:histidine kinase n=1 Tax=Flavipsychrobacter stenotrophus TaxID=2077091 RepID=A0A2S7ST01_9BACT|nr:PAS domain S-box protein [Flavipsychrobacter stenotrophus]PQJ10059.1 hypothetical protein CJD36_015280 [Flavipsychrobacter stenotrophus]
MNEDIDIYKQMVAEIEDYAILFLDKRGNIRNWNKGAQKIKGYSSDEIIGENFRVFYSPDDQAKGVPEQMIKEASLMGKASAEGWRIRKDGTAFWGSVLITALFGDSNVLKGFTKITRDLTEKKLAEENLQKINAELEAQIEIRTRELNLTQNSYRHLFINNPMPMWVIDVTTFQFLDVNDVAVASYGYSREEFFAMTAVEIRPDDEQLAFIETSHSPLINASEYNRGVWRHKKKDSTIIYVEIFAYNVVFNDRMARLVMSIDITARRMAEKKLVSSVRHFRALLENSYDSISLLDSEGCIKYQTPSVERMLGYGIDEIIDTSEFDLFHPDDVQEGKKRFEMAISSPGRPIWGIYRMRHKNGYYIWVEGTTTNLLDNENVNAIVNNFRDITERKLAGESLSKSKREVEKVYRDQILLSERLSSILNALPANIALLDNTGKIMEVNDAWRRFADENGFIGNSYGIGDNYIIIAEQADGVESEDGARIANAIKAILAGHIRDFSMEYRCDAPGKDRWLKVIVTKENNSAESGIVLMHLDISERREAEEKLRSSEHKFRALVENSMDAIALLNEEGRVMYQSASSENVTSYSVKELLENEVSIVHPDDRGKLHSLFASTIQNPGVPQFSRHRIAHKEKGWIDVEGTLTNLLNDKDVQAIVTNFRDVTERIQAEQRITNVNRLYSVISQINQTIVHSGSEKEVLREACRIAVEFGHFKMAWIGMLDIQNQTLNLVEADGMHPEDANLFRDVHYKEVGPTEQVLLTGKYYVCNDIANAADLDYWKPYAAARGILSTMILPIKKTGKIIGMFNLYATETNLFNEDEIKLLQEVAGDISFALDVFETEKQRKEVEERLKQNEFRLNEAQEIAHVGNWEIDLITNTHSWSQEAQRIIGFVSESEQPVFDTYLASIHPDDKVSVMKMMNESRATYQNAYFYHRIVRPGGEIRYVYSESKFEFNEFNEPVRLHGIIHDITNAKHAEDSLAQSEENLRLIMDLIPQCIYAKNANGKFIFVNKSFAKLYGYSPTQLISKSITESESFNNVNDFMPEQDREIIFGGNTAEVPEVLFTDHEGKQRIFYIIKVPYTLPATSERAVLGIALDITERKHAEMERTKIIADIVQRNKDLEQFSYIISHNLRAPVANIIGISEILKIEDLPLLENNELMADLSTSIQKLDAVIKDLNYILQVKQEHNESREYVLFNDLLSDIKHSISHIIAGERVNIKGNFEVVEGITTLKSYLYSVFYNLISNSIKCRQPGVAPVIEIRSTKKDKKVVLTFKDNGLGIDLVTKGEQVFGLYKRFHYHTEGKGIGLYMVKTQVETLGGRIRVNSEVNKGTEFTIEFEIN